jgi:hypothetical protein
VGRTSICYYHQGDDGMEEVGKAPTWTRRRWRWCSIEADIEEEWAHSVDLMAVGEVVSEPPVWT